MCVDTSFVTSFSLCSNDKNQQHCWQLVYLVIFVRVLCLIKAKQTTKNLIDFYIFRINGDELSFRWNFRSLKRINISIKIEIDESIRRFIFSLFHVWQQSRSGELTSRKRNDQMKKKDQKQREIKKHYSSFLHFLLSTLFIRSRHISSKTRYTARSKWN